MVVVAAVTSAVVAVAVAVAAVAVAVVAAAESAGRAGLFLVDLKGAGITRTAVTTVDPTRSHARIVFDGAAAEPLGAPGVRHERCRESEPQVLGDRELLKDAEASRHVSDAGLDPSCQPCCRDVLTAMKHATAVGSQQAVEHLEQCGFAGAVVPEETNKLAGALLHVQVEQNLFRAIAGARILNVPNEVAIGSGHRRSPK